MKRLNATNGWSSKGRTLALTASIASVSALAYESSKHRREPLRLDRGPLQLQLSPTMIEGAAGAVGEMIQTLILYPLDTVKVRCQALGLSGMEVVKQLLKSSNGLSSLIRNFYAGALGAGICSIPIGAVHFASFECSKRFLLDAMNGGEASFPSSNTTEAKEDRKMKQMVANVMAAILAAIATAVLESPVELFRHNQQASSAGSAGSKSFLREMGRVLRQSGPAGLYWGFLPHCFEAWPHDIAELLVYGALVDYQTEALSTSKPSTQWVRDMSAGPGFSLFIGASAGAASVLVSMPFDSIKTYVQTHAACDVSKASGFFDSSYLFFRSGSEMVSKRGVGSLYSGVVPRLLQRVPSSMVNWAAISAIQKLLQSYNSRQVNNTNS